MISQKRQKQAEMVLSTTAEHVYLGEKHVSTWECVRDGEGKGRVFMS